MHGVLPDDTVATAAAKLEAQLSGGDVYMWCERPVDAHEALAIAVAGGAHETGRNYSPSVAARELKSRLGVSVTAARASTPLKLLEFLRKLGDPLFEPVSMRNRYVIPGGYFANDEVDPFRVTAPDKDFAAAHARPFNTGDLLVESFGADTVMVTTRRDVEDFRPKSTPAASWASGVIDKYFPAVQDRDLYRFTPKSDRMLREQRRIPLTREPIVTYLPMTGGMPVGESPGPDRLIAAFAALSTSESRPVVRVQGGGIDRPVTRVHDSYPDESIRRMRVPVKKDWLQVVVKLDKGSAVLMVLPSGVYKLQIRFGYLEKAVMADAVRYFEPVNEVLRTVSPLIRPLSEAHVRPSSSLYIQKPQLLDTPSVLGGPSNGVYQTVYVDLPARCTLDDVSAVIAARGFPSLKAINHHAGNFHMQWTRANSLRKSSVVKNLIYHSSKNGGLTAARMDELTAELGLSRKEIAEMAASKFTRNASMTLVKAHLSSDTKLTVTVNGNDPEYGRRIGETLSNLLRECGKGRSKGVTDWSSAVSDSPDQTPTTSLGDMDEFYEFFEEEGEEEELAPAPASAPPPAQKGDILERLKDADPKVFAFPGQPGYVPYSMKCQKNSKTTRQPLVLSPAELASAEMGSTGDALEHGLAYRGNTYICPEKWCPVSGVARTRSEPCPDPDEPEWTMWNNNYPAFQPGVAHPDGLCMPCCFGTKIKPGGKKWEDLQKCVETDDVAVKRNKAGHVNKPDKLLSEGAFGKVPADMYRGALYPVRRGMGDKTKATLANAAAFALGVGGGGGALLRAIAAGLLPEHFIQCDVREFMTAEDAAVAETVDEARVRRWTTDPYAKAAGIRALSLTPPRLRREARIMLAHARCVQALARGIAPSDVSLFRLLNSGALPEAPPLILVELDDAGNAYAEHACEHSMPASGSVVVVLKKRTVYEPVGFKHRNAFRPAWDAADPWVQRVFASVREQTPPCRRRVTSYSVMAVGCLTKTGYLPFARPVFIDPAYEHSHVSDLASLDPASEADARSALAATKNPFYASKWKDVASRTRSDSEKDEALFSAPVEDARSRTMRDIAEKLETVASFSLDIDPASLALLPGESTRKQIKRLRGAEGAAADLAIERLVRPIPSGVIPAVKTHGRERITFV